MNISGTSKKKADALSSRIKEVLAGVEWVRVSRSSRQLKLRLSDFEESVLADDVVSALVEQGGCDKAEIRVGEIP